MVKTKNRSLCFLSIDRYCKNNYGQDWCHVILCCIWVSMWKWDIWNTGKIGLMAGCAYKMIYPTCHKWLPTVTG